MNINIKNILSIVGVSSFIYYIFRKRKRNIFVSYHSKNDAKYKSLLCAWQKNEYFEFDFHDKSIGISINSTNDSRIKAGITKKINESNLILCIVGKETHERPMVNWELEKAKELDKKIIVVKTNSKYKTPSCLLNSGIKILNKFEQKSIIKEIYKS